MAQEHLLEEAPLQANDLFFSPALLLISTNGTLEWVNAAFEQCTGLSAAELKGKTLANFLAPHAASRQTYAEMLRHMKAGSSFAYRLTLQYPRATTTEFLLKGEPLPQPGSTTRLSYLIQQLPLNECDNLAEDDHLNGTTAGSRTPTAANWMHSEQMLRYAIDAAGEGYWDWDIAANRLFVSVGFLKMLGYPPHYTFTPDAWLELIHPDDRPLTQQSCHNHIAGTAPNYTAKHRKKCYDGSYLWVLDRGVIVQRDAAGNPLRMIGFQSNISELKKQELLLRETNETAEIGGWEYDLRTGKLFWSELTREIHEVEPGYTPDVETAINFYKEGKSRDTVRQRVQACIETGASFDEVLELVTATGKTKWVQTKGKAQFENGKCIRIYGAFRDVTKERTLQLQLQLATQEFRSLFDNNPDAVAAFDAQGNVIAINQQMLVAGEIEDPAQVIGTHYSRFVPPHRQPEAQQHHERTMSGQCHTYEIELFTFTGRLRFVSVVSVPVIVDEQVIGTYAIIRDITEQRAMQQQLQQSRERFQLAVEGARDGIWDLDYRTGTRYKSERFAEMLGYSLEQLMDEEFFLSLPHPDDLAIRAKALEDHLTGKVPYYHVEFRMRCADGTYRWFLSRGKALFDETGAPIRISGSLTDIHEQKLTQEALAESKDRLQAAVVGSRDGIFDWNITTGVTYFSDRFYELLQHSSSSIVNNLNAVISLLHPDDKVEIQQKLDSQLLSQRGNYFDAEFRLLSGEGSYRWNRMRAQITRDEDGKAIRFSGALTDVHEHKQLQTELKATNLFLQQHKQQLSELVALQNAILNALPDKIFRLKRNGRISFCKVSQNTHLFEADIPVVGDNLVKRLGPVWDLQAAIEATLRNNTLTVHEFFADKPKGRYYFEARLLPMEGGEVLLIIRNITDKKIAEEERAKNELKYTRLIENMNIGLLEVDRNEIITRAHPRFCEMMGYTEAELLGRNAREVLLPDPEDSRLLEMNKRRLEGKTDIYEARLKSKSGKIVDVLFSGAPLTNEKGEIIGSVGIHYNISDKKQAERLLEASNRVAQIGTYLMDLSSSEFIWNEITREIFEVDAAFQPNMESVLAMYKPHSRLLALQQFEVMLQTGRHTDMELEIVTAKGNTRWIRIVSQPERVNNKVIRLSGVVQDITQTKQIQLQLQQHAMLSETIINSIRDGFYVLDSNWNFVFINEAAGRYLHKNWRELLGQNIWKFFPHEKNTFLPLCEEVCTSKQPISVIQDFEIDSEKFWFEINIYPTAANGVSVLFKDITNIRKQEVEIRKLNERYNAVLRATSQVIFEWNLITDEICFNEVFYKLTGYPNTPAVNTGAFGYTKVHPDDLKLMQTTLQKAFAVQKPLVELTCRFQRASGDYLTLRSRGLVQYNEAGQPVSIMGVCEDMSDTIRLNESLIQERVNLQRRVHEATIRVQEAEREHIGRELHDNVNQILTTASLCLQLAENDGHPAAATLQTARTYINDAIQEIRTISRQLAPPSLKDIGLTVALTDLVTMVNNASQTTFSISVPDEAEFEIDNERRLVVYRICQELLNNVVKYAEAQNCHITLANVNGKSITLRVTDDGKGFDPARVKKGLGLSNTVTRVEVYGGAFRIRSAPGNGCTVEVELPLQ
jgi:PAS domain S-box-containing protein